MFLTALMLNQLLFPNFEPVATLYQPQLEGITLTKPELTVAGTIEVPKLTPVAILKKEPLKGMPLEKPKLNVIATWNF